MLPYLILSVLAVVAAMVVFVATRPAHFRIERSAQIDAPAGVVFPLINDLRQWQLWSPFEKLDPDVKKTFTGPDAGPGASYAWSGNSKAGQGCMTVTDSKPGELVAMKLEFVKPFTCTNQVRFTLTPSGSGTRVSWAMEGKNTFVGKAFAVLMSMDKMVGKEFAEGLANLNTVARGQTAAA